MTFILQQRLLQCLFLKNEVNIHFKIASFKIVLYCVKRFIFFYLTSIFFSQSDRFLLPELPLKPFIKN